jgi:hypothetical protein
LRDDPVEAAVKTGLKGRARDESRRPSPSSL